MDEKSRLNAANVLIVLSRSPRHEDRVDAGRCLANFVDIPGVSNVLFELALDPNDTAVTLATADALLRRKDRLGVTVLARALAVADSNHADWIYPAVSGVFGIFERDRDVAIRICEELLGDADSQLRLGLLAILDTLAGIEPIVRVVPSE